MNELQLPHQNYPYLRRKEQLCNSNYRYSLTILMKWTLLVLFSASRKMSNAHVMSAI